MIKFIGVIPILWSSLTFYSSFDTFRRVKTGKEENRFHMLVQQGYSITEEEFKEISSRVKMISFDWGGVLDLIFINKEEFRKLLQDVFAEFKNRGIQLVIISEGNPETIGARLKDLGWEDYFEIRQSLETMSILPKRTVLEKLAEEKGIESDSIIHFDDSAQILWRLGYQTGEKNIFGIGVVGWREEDGDFKVRVGELLQNTPWVVTDLKSIYEVLAQILEYNSSELYHHSP